MITFGNVSYYIDLDKIDELISNDESLKSKEMTDKIIKVFKDDKGKITHTEERFKTYVKPKEINGIRYETLSYLIQIIMADGEPMDDILGTDRAFESMPLSYKIAFNTLLKFGVIVMEEN